MRTQPISSGSVHGNGEPVPGFSAETEAYGGTPSIPRCNLTAAEGRVLNLVSRAKTNKEIAGDLGISPATVKRHLENLLRKLHLRNRVEAAIYGLLMAGCPRGLDRHCPLELWHRHVIEGTGPFGR